MKRKILIALCLLMTACLLMCSCLGQTAVKTETKTVDMGSMDSDTNPADTQDLEYSQGLEFTFSEDTGTYAVTGIGQCEDEEIVIPPEYNGIAVTRIGAAAFKDTSISGVIIPDSVTEIGISAFFCCHSLRNASIPDSVTVIRDSAFSGCTELYTVRMPAGVTAIEDYAFSGCLAIKEITIPAKVSSIGMFAFYGCTDLTRVTVPASVTSMGKMVFDSTVTISCEAAEKPEGWASNWTSSENVEWGVK